MCGEVWVCEAEERRVLNFSVAYGIWDWYERDECTKVRMPHQFHHIGSPNPQA
jgi:hypothetical protein